MTREIALANGRGITLVDDEDYERLMTHRWHLSSSGYAARSGGTSPYVLMHREILAVPTMSQIDHVNGDRLNNTRGNLRACSASENQRNRVANRGRLYKGAYYRSKCARWQAEIRVDGVKRHLGMHPSAEDAARAYDRAAIEHFGQFARLNFPLIKAS